MCSIFFAWDFHPDYPLVVAANRDEFYDRPTQPAKFHGIESTILSGLDIQAGGTWMGYTKAGRFSALTNFRDLSKIIDDAPSRGELVARFLSTESSPVEFYESIKEEIDRYNPFNILLGRGETLYYYSNVRHVFQQLYGGVYGLSNHLLNTPWPKVEKGRIALQHIISHEPSERWRDMLFELLADREEAPDHELPDTGVGAELEKRLSPIFIATGHYGTRTSTVMLVNRWGEVSWMEKTFDKGKFSAQVAYEFKVELSA